MFSIPDKTLFVFAHMDDETILSFGTLMKLKQMGSIVKLLCLCGCGRKEQEDCINRIKTFESIMDEIGCEYTLSQFNDLTLSNECLSIIDVIISEFKPSMIVTHHKDDIHFEHKLVYDRVFLDCRAKQDSSVDILLTTLSSPISYIDGGLFKPNCFIDISEFGDMKKDAIERYTTEIPSDTLDIRSSSSIMLWNEMWGRLVHKKLVEPYTVVFQR